MKQRLIAAFTLIEILSVAVVVVILMSILLPVFLWGQQHAKDTTCLSNLRQLSASIQMYVADYDDRFPPAIAATFTDNHTKSDKTWRDLILSYIQGKGFPSCPLVRLTEKMALSERAIDYSGYAYNKNLNQRIHLGSSDTYSGKDDTLLNYPASTITLLDARAGILALRNPDIAISTNVPHGIWRTDDTDSILKQEIGASRHHGGANYSFADGHV